jgi:hypothetical protein
MEAKRALQRREILEIDERLQRDEVIGHGQTAGPRFAGGDAVALRFAEGKSLGQRFTESKSYKAALVHGQGGVPGLGARQRFQRTADPAYRDPNVIPAFAGPTRCAIW